MMPPVNSTMSTAIRDMDTSRSTSVKPWSAPDDREPRRRARRRRAGTPRSAVMHPPPTVDVDRLAAGFRGWCRRGVSGETEAASAGGVEVGLREAVVPGALVVLRGEVA